MLKIMHQSSVKTRLIPTPLLIGTFFILDAYNPLSPPSVNALQIATRINQSKNYSGLKIDNCYNKSYLLLMPLCRTFFNGNQR